MTTLPHELVYMIATCSPGVMFVDQVSSLPNNSIAEMQGVLIWVYLVSEIMLGDLRM
jgi:hypothetical protein